VRLVRQSQLPGTGSVLKKTLSVIFLLLSSGVLVLGQKTPVYKGREEKLPAAVAPQPIAFSHKKHAAAEIACLDCHADATEKDFADIPNVEQCMLCHQSIKTESAEVKKLAAIQKRNEKMEWVPVYRVPDFVFFSHVNHLKAGEQCVTCHGPVAERDVLAKEVSTSMTSCMNCHASRKVSNACDLCHQLGY